VQVPQPNDLWSWLSAHGVAIATFVTVLGWGWKLNSTLSKFYFTVKEFPPHIHTEGDKEPLSESGVRYPVGMRPDRRND